MVSCQHSCFVFQIHLPPVLSFLSGTSHNLESPHFFMNMLAHQDPPPAKKNIATQMLVGMGLYLTEYTACVGFTVQLRVTHTLFGIAAVDRRHLLPLGTERTSACAE